MAERRRSRVVGDGSRGQCAAARSTGAQTRRAHAADLLHLALLYGPGGLSLRSGASHATEAGIADLCDVSLLDRLRNAGEFPPMCWTICWRIAAAIRQREGRVQLSLVDGSTVSLAGSDGSDWRLHARYETGRWAASPTW